MTKENVDQVIRCVKECWWRVGLVFLIPSIAVISLSVDWKPSSSITDWLTAVGTVAAVVATVALYWDGRKKAEKKELANFLSFLLSNQAEWETFHLKISAVEAAINTCLRGLKGPPLGALPQVLAPLLISNDDLLRALVVARDEGKVFHQINNLVKKITKILTFAGSFSFSSDDEIDLGLEEALVLLDDLRAELTKAIALAVEYEN